MTTSRSQIPVTNLKERIAALEQRNADSAASVQRATSPTPSVTSNGSQSGSSNGALRDRIARFEKKGGVPVPRGRFGFGAPLSVEGPRKRGELYGNRIPVPVRTVSGGTLPLSRPVSTATYDQRRSFSASSVISDLDDDHLEYSPLSSPTFTLPPDSPDSITSLSITPDISPSLGDFANVKQHMARGTSFAQALELARKADIEKREREKSTSLGSRSPPLSENDGHVESPTETAPTIVISSADVSPVLMPEIPIENATPVPPTAPTDSSPPEKVQSNKELPYKSPPENVVTNDVSPVITTTTHKPLEDNGIARVGTPPLTIRKRTPADPGVLPVENKPSKGLDTNAVPIEPQVLVSTVTPNPQAVKFDDVPSSDNHKEGMVECLPTSQPKLVEVGRQVPSENIEKPSASKILPPPNIVVFNERSEESDREAADASINSNAGVRSRQVGLTLDAGKLNDESLMSPPPRPVHAPHRAASASAGTLESFSTALASKANTPPDSFLSPPGTGLHAESPSSGSSLSSLGSRPMSMIETSPKLVTQMLRMTPATSRGVPMFLPPKQDLPRKSDFLYFPPTPEDENADVGSLTMQNSSHSNRRRRGSDPEDIRSMPSKQTFSAVVHRKVRELPASATVPDNKIRPLPQTPQSQRVKRATILETPLSPGHGELAALLHEAVLLEDTLNKGELPSEDPHVEEEKEKRAKEAAAAQAKAKAEEKERSQLALATAQLQSKRDEPTTGRLKHTFLVPLSRARSQHRKEVHITKPEIISEEPKSAGLISQSTANSFATASATLPKMPAKRPTLDSISSDHSNTQPPAKSSKSPRFASLRKLGSVSRATAGDGASARTTPSISSEVSSEESSSAVTAENNHEFGQGTGSTLSFPTVSPKKTSKTLARASSFAEKLWSRSRTKSGGSTLSSTSEVNDRLVDDSPVKRPVAGTQATGLPPSLNLPTLHHSPVVPLLSLEEKDEPDPIVPLRRSTSSKRSAMYFSRDHDLTAVPQLPPAVPGFQIPPRASPSSFLPVSNDFNRPSSANSVSSIGSLPSPLFSRELMDAFPSVPATTPTTTNKFPHRDTSFATHTTTTSFDTALLSSAIHLASTRRQDTPKASLQPLPSERVATPTATSGDVGHSLKV